MHATELFVPKRAELPRTLHLRPLTTTRVTYDQAPHNSQRQHDKEKEKEQEQEEEDEDDSKARKGTIRERLRYLMRRYGWWALGVYNAASLVDFSLIFLSIHLLGAQHIRQMEQKVRAYIGLAQRDEEEDESEQGGKSSKKSNSMWTEAALAYTIHKTLFLPFRVAFTAAVTPSFVKWLVKMGWARSHAAVRKAAEQAAKKGVKQ